MNLPNSICMLPWISLEITPMGTFRPCCIYREDIPNMSVHQGHSIHDAQHSEYMQDLRKQFLEGKKPNGCQSCWQEELIPSRISKRKSTFIKCKDIKIEYTENDVTINFLDIKLGNICNLKCRICGSWSSSKWAQEEIELSNGKNDQAKNQHKLGQWPRTNEDWWKNLDDVLPTIKFIEITGGEPFLIDQHFDLLQRLVDLNYARNIDIHYNTNGTVWPSRGPEIWKNFKRVEIAFSIDDTGKRFEYQRYGSDWKKTNEIIQNAVKIENIFYQICTTFNIQNTYYWPNTLDWIQSIGITDIHPNILHSLPVFNLRNTSKSVKEAIEKRLLSTLNTYPRIHEVIGFMNVDGTNLTKELIQHLEKHDKYRKENFAQIHPELWSLINV